MKYLLLLFSCFSIALSSAQTDSSKGNKTQIAQHHVYTHQDTVYLTRLNNSGNLMIGGGVGLCGVAGWLIYEGVLIYGTQPAPNSTDPAGDTNRNHRQGTLYLAGGGLAIAGGIVLIAFGAKNKIDFKIRKKIMSLQSGLLDDGKLGLAINF